MHRAVLLRVYLGLSGAVFLFVAAFHVFRIIGHWQILVSTFAVPRLLSWVGGPASSAYALCAFLLLWWEIRSPVDPVAGHGPPRRRRRGASHIA